MTREEFLALASSKYDSIRDLNKLDNFYDYEKELVDIMRDLGSSVMELNLGKISTNPKKKKLLKQA